MLIEILIPIMAKIEQEKYINREELTCVYGNVSTNGILNIVMINYIFYHCCDMQKELENHFFLE